MIKITNLNKYFYKNRNNEIHVINDATYAFPETGLVTIFGESGSGKTTLMNVIGGLDSFYSGEIEIDGKKISKYKSKVIDRIRNEKIGYIFQNYLLLHQRTVYDNLKIVLDMYDISEKEKNDRIEYVLKSVGMLRYKKKNVSKLSGGQQQRIAIARALIKSPSLILADEPTGNLDEKNTIQIMNIIKKISKTTLVILVSHEQKLARSYADYIINVCDGKITNTEEVKNDNEYEFTDDSNLYLKEYKYNKIENDNVKLEFYSNKDVKINLQIVYENDRFYLKTEDNLLHLDNSNEVLMINEHKKPLDTSKVSEKYNLNRLEYKRSPRLSFKEIMKLAFSNLKKLKKRTMILSFPLIVISILTMFFIQSVEAARFVDYQNIVSIDSHTYNVKIEKTHSRVESNTLRFGYKHFYSNFIKDNPNIEPLLNFTQAKFTFNVDEFSQVSNKQYNMKGFSILPLDKVKEESLIYGRMPELAHEIVVEKWVLERAISDSTLENFKDVYSFLNDEVNYNGRNYSFKIVGISNNDENSVYMNEWAIFDVYPSNIPKVGYKIISYSEFLKYLDYDPQIELDTFECIANKKLSFVNDTYSYVINQDFDLRMDKVSVLDFQSCPYDLVLSDDAFDEIFISAISTDYTTFDVYCDNEEEIAQVRDYLDKVNPYYSSGDLRAAPEFGYTGIKPDFDYVMIKFIGYSNYENAVTPYELESQRVLNSRILITSTIILIGAIIIYFSMKSFTIKNIYDIGVYRALGIKKISIIQIYLTEIFIISLKSTVLFLTIGYFLNNFIASIPTNSTSPIELNVYLISLVSLLAVNLVSGVLPILGYLRLTPSQILSKYDI